MNCNLLVVMYCYLFSPVDSPPVRKSPLTGLAMTSICYFQQADDGFLEMSHRNAPRDSNSSAFSFSVNSQFSRMTFHLIKMVNMNIGLNDE